MLHLFPSAIMSGLDVAALDQFLNQHRQMLTMLVVSCWLLFVVSLYLLKKRGLDRLRVPMVCGLVGFVLSVAGLETIRNTVERQAWTEIDSVLTGRLVSVEIDDKTLASDETFIKELANMRTHAPPGHHSTSLPRQYKVVIATTSGHLLLSLRRNDGDRREYWVDYPRYFTTSPIAHLRTAALDQF